MVAGPVEEVGLHYHNGSFKVSLQGSVRPTAHKEQLRGRNNFGQSNSCFFRRNMHCLVAYKKLLAPV